ncbi:MAG TPA: hypothetical protein VNN09_08555 [Candidatus Competibacteraceae bacterium]|nr:hypothetical protein [Candidatus Competibacteraceae bacterium]
MRKAFRFARYSLLPALALLSATAASATEGKWLERGQPLTEFPACYQLWACVASDASSADKSQGIPKGTWGTCENMMQGEQAGCGKCLAPPPEDQCEI